MGKKETNEELFVQENRIVGTEWEVYQKHHPESADVPEDERTNAWGDWYRQFKSDARQVVSLFSNIAGNREYEEPSPETGMDAQRESEEDQANIEDAVNTLSDRDEAEKQRMLVALQEQFVAREQKRVTRIANRMKLREQRLFSRTMQQSDEEQTEAAVATAPQEHEEQIGENAELVEAETAPAATDAVEESADTDETTISVSQQSGVHSYHLNQTYTVPDQTMLSYVEEHFEMDPDELERRCQILQRTIDSFGIDARVTDTVVGPRVTMFRVDPAQGVKVERIAHISNNIAMELAATSIQILAPVPGRPYVGIEVPNPKGATVGLRAMLEDANAPTKANLPMAIGRNIRNEAIFLDLVKAPHLLIAGATGSGKSVCLNALLVSLLLRFSPEDLRLILVDPKVVEFSYYEKLPHLITPVVNDTDKVVPVLSWLIQEMDRRYQVLGKTRTRNLEAFNNRGCAGEGEYLADGEHVPAKLPYIVVVIDELADIMMSARADVETAIARIAQKSRAVGIHLILATQRPSVNVITGVIKSNLPTRIAFQVSSQVDARTILDRKGAEVLLGRGDMLYAPPGAAHTERLQSPMVLDEDIEQIVEYAASQAEQEFDMSVFETRTLDSSDSHAPDATGDMSEELQEAMEIVVNERRASTSYLQRRLRIGYNRAAELMDQLEEHGIVGPSLGAKPREVLVDEL